MSIGTLIHNKLITDFAALKFENNTTALFTNVKKFYAVNTMDAKDCLIVPDSTPENVEGGSAGNFQTTREYTFRAIFIEKIGSSDSDSEADIKYSRLLNTADSVLDYLQKEPSNLNSWGATNNIAIYKIRTKNPRYNVQETTSGLAEICTIPFTIYLNVIPQSL